MTRNATRSERRCRREVRETHAPNESHTKAAEAFGAGISCRSLAVSVLAASAFVVFNELKRPA